MRSRFALVAAALAVGAGATAAPAMAAGPEKAPRDGDRLAETAPPGLGSFGRTVPGRVALLVAFTDRPGTAEAASRLAGIGTVRPLAPEVGLFRVTPASPATARREALGREAVGTAEWSLQRTQDDVVPPTPPAPLPLVDPGPFTDEYATPSGQWPLFLNSLWRPVLTGTATRPRIAILDGGVDVDHEEWRGAGSPLVQPRTTAGGRADADDWGRSGHGTHVAGIAAAPANGVGIVGVAPGRADVAEVVPVQIADRDGRSTDETMIAGIRWAVRAGAKVINISAGGPGFSRAFQSTVNWAFGRGALIVASVGNEGEDENTLNFPAGYDHVLGVGAQCDGDVDPPDCTRAFGVAAFSNHNRTVDVVAPGVNVLSTVPRSVTDRLVAPGYALKDGTSMASPYVAGVAALVFAANPGISPFQVMRQLMNTATDMGRGGRDDLSGEGLVNPEAAVRLTPPADDPLESNDDVPDLAARRSFERGALPLRIVAAADQWNDPEDVYPLQLRAGDRVRVSLNAPSGFLNLYVWRPGTRTVSTSEGSNIRRNLIAFAANPRRRTQTVTVTARASGRYDLDVYARRGGGTYSLTVTRA